MNNASESDVASSVESSRKSSEESSIGGVISQLPQYDKYGRSQSCFNLTRKLSDGDEVPVFPNIPDELLEEMGFKSDEIREIHSEEEVEQKFTALSLAFSIDSTTIKDRIERQRRYRDQTEKNFTVEIERLTERANALTRLCVDIETTQLLANLLAQIDIVLNAAILASASAERYGAVQEEERLSDAVKLMVNHVNYLKQQRDWSRKQLHYTKRMLQETDSKDGSIKDKRTRSQNLSPTSRRRASISIASLQNSKMDKTITRRTSELAFRTNAVPKLPKPSRMDLGVDLGKIKEGMVEEPHNSDVNGSESSAEKTTDLEESEEERQQSDNSNKSYLDSLRKKILIIYQKTNNEFLSTILYTCSILCFCFAIIFMIGVYFELEVKKKVRIV